MIVPKDYLGDAVYAEFNGHALILTTSDGITDTNVIEFDQDTLVSLDRYIQRIKKEASHDLSNMRTHDAEN